MEYSCLNDKGSDNSAELTDEKTKENNEENDLSSIFSMARRFANLEVADLEAEVKEKGVLVPHHRQHFNWDCGIACAKMVR